MANKEAAIKLATELGFEVFPLKSDGRPYTEHGFKEATSDPVVIKKIWRDDALIGVYTGGSGILVLDLDMKVDEQGNVLVDGFTSLDEAWLDVPETYAYDSRNGLGRHLVYRAPEGVNLPRSMGYRGMKGVDRCSGSGYVAWMGGVPSLEEISEAPEWLLDARDERKVHNFEGELKEWYEGLVLGEPNALVRKAMERAQERFTELGNDFSHSHIVELQFELVRLGAEGNSGVKDGLEFLEDLFLSREGAHSRSEGDWPYEWAEALQSAVAKYGDSIELLKSLPEYNIAMVPASIPDALVTSPGTKADFSKLLGALVKETDDDNRILSILWNCSGTKKWAREWGLEFTAKRIQDARHTPEPTRENPAIEEKREAEAKGKPTTFDLLTEEEREYLKTRPTFVDRVEQVAKSLNYDQLPYFRSAAWTMAAMAFSFKGFIPLSKTHKMGLNLWHINLGLSGTGKSVVGGFRDSVLRTVFEGDNEGGIPFSLGEDSSPQGLHAALLDRDRKASLFSSDEAAGFFSTLGLRDWKTGLDEKITSWYNGYVEGSNKLTMKELRGKTALTSFNMSMFGTPDKVTKVITADMFETGFMARVNWVIGNPPKDDGSRFMLDIDTSEDVEDFDTSAPEITELASDLMAAVAHLDKPAALKPAPGVMKRLSEAYKATHDLAKGKENFDIIDPSLTRLAETMMKCAGICALYRSSETIEMVDALHAIRAAEEWNRNLHTVVGMVSAGDFQRRASEIEAWVSSQGGTVTRTRLFHRFRNFIEKDSRELDSLLTYLVESGTMNRLEEGKSGVKYALNGGV